MEFIFDFMRGLGNKTVFVSFTDLIYSCLVGFVIVSYLKVLDCRRHYFVENTQNDTFMFFHTEHAFSSFPQKMFGTGHFYC